MVAKVACHTMKIKIDILESCSCKRELYAFPIYMFVGWLVVFGFKATLALSQTTNFRLFKTERVCRQQFQIQ